MPPPKSTPNQNMTNPQPPPRKPIRLREYDYSTPGSYFITICVNEKKHLFGKIHNREMFLNRFGKIAQKCWIEIPNYFPTITLDEFVIMPNHLHGILIISGSTLTNINGESFATRAGASPAPTIPYVVGVYKSLVTKEILEIVKKNNKNYFLGKIWQRGFYDHIIRSEKSLEKIREYIITNPYNWENDDMFL